VHSDWKLDRVMISAWGAPSDDATAQAYVDAGFNTVMATAELLDLCARHGLRVLVKDATPEQAAQLKAHAGVWGWYVQDEPKAEDLGKVGERVGLFHAADADHPAYVNLMAWMDLEQYLGTVKPRFLSYDYYQWWWGSPNYCWRLEAHRAAALQAGLPLLCWIEANADPRYEWGKPGATYLPDNLPKLRQSVALAVAYGVQGIQWFTAGLCFDKDGKLSQSGQDIARINLELQALGPTLLTLTSTAVYHTNPLPPHTVAVPADLWVQSPDDNLSFGLFSSRTSGQKHLVVVNRDLATDREVSLHLAAGVAGLEAFVPASGQWQALELQRPEPQTPTTRVKLLAGGTVLLRVP
jgi:hypothetical protein